MRIEELYFIMEESNDIKTNSEMRLGLIEFMAKTQTRIAKD